MRPPCAEAADPLRFTDTVPRPQQRRPCLGMNEKKAIPTRSWGPSGWPLTLNPYRYLAQPATEHEIQCKRFGGTNFRLPLSQGGGDHTGGPGSRRHHQRSGSNLERLAADDVGHGGTLHAGLPGQEPIYSNIIGGHGSLPRGRTHKAEGEPVRLPQPGIVPDGSPSQALPGKPGELSKTFRSGDWPAAGKVPMRFDPPVTVPGHEVIGGECEGKGKAALEW